MKAVRISSKTETISCEPTPAALASFLWEVLSDQDNFVCIGSKMYYADDVVFDDDAKAYIHSDANPVIDLDNPSESYRIRGERYDYALQVATYRCHIADGYLVVVCDFYGEDDIEIDITDAYAYINTDGSIDYGALKAHLVAVEWIDSDAIVGGVFQ